MKGLVIFLNKRIIETVSIMCAQTPQTVKNRKTIVQRGSRKKVDSTPTARSPKRKTVSRKKQKKKGTSKWLFFKRWPSWAIWVGALSLGIAYILFFYYFFVGPSYMFAQWIGTPIPALVPVSTILTFICSWSFTYLVSKLPHAKYIIG